MNGCSKKGVSEDLDSTSTEPSITRAAEETTNGMPELEEYVASDYITLGQYKDIEVTVTKLEVTNEDIETAIQQDLNANSTDEEVTDRAIKKGDIVNIDYEGLLDGVAFDGGTAQGYDLEIGSGSFIKGFEEGLIGAKIGDTKKLDITFPKEYASADLAGKAVVFNVKINSIKISIVPELNEEYVAKNTKFKTVDEYKEAMRSELKANNQSQMDDEKANMALKAIIENSTIKSIPETLTNYFTASINYQLENQASYYGMSKEDYMSAMNIDESQMKEAVKNQSQSVLVMKAIAEKERLEISDEEYKTTVSDMMTKYSITTEEELFAQISENEIRDNLIMQKAYNLVVENTEVAYE